MEKLVTKISSNYFYCLIATIVFVVVSRFCSALYYGYFDEFLGDITSELLTSLWMSVVVSLVIYWNHRLIKWVFRNK